MDSKARTQLAQDLVARTASEYPLLIGGVYGSTTRGEDTAWSDLELWFVVEDGCDAQGRHILFRDIAVGWRVYRESELVEILTHPDGRWPFLMGVLDVLQVLHGNPKKVQEWLALGRVAPLERFHAHLAKVLPELIVESHGRMHSAFLRNDLATFRYSLDEVLFEMRPALCLLNRRWVTRDYDAGLLQTLDFPKLPTEYTELIPAILAAWDFSSLPLADRLVKGFWDLVAAEQIEVVNYHHVDQVPV